MSGDDWEPLPEELVSLHPGEFRDPAPAPVPPPRRAAPPVRADAEGEAALQRLQQRLARQQPGTSLVAAVQRHHDEVVAARRAALQGALVVAAPVAATVDADRDPREQEPWFQSLPTAERERLRAFWWHERHREDDAGVRLRRRLGRAVGYGALLFFVLSVLLVLLQGHFLMVPVLTAAGALGAGCAELLGGGRFVYAAAGAVVFVVTLGPTSLLQPLGVMALMLTTYTMGALGMDGEMRRSGGFAQE